MKRSESPPGPAAGTHAGRRTSLLLLGLLEGGLLAGLGWIPGARHTPLPALALWVGAFSAYLLAARLLADSAVPRWAVWLPGLAMRGALLPLTPAYSDDVYRYLWDGWVQLHGVNPYLHAPADPALAGLRTAWHSLINHPEIPTIYPPGAQVVFWVLAALAPSVLLFKAAWVACDLGVARLLERLEGGGRGARPAAGSDTGPASDGGDAPRRPRPGLVLLLYLWSPLAVVEVAWSGHLEPLGILPMLAALLFLRKGPGRPDRPGKEADHRGAVGASLLGLGTAVKLAPAAAFPALLRRRGAAVAALAAGIPLLLYLPYVEAGSDLVAGLATYAGRWEFNPGPFLLLEGILGPGTGRIAAALGVGGIAVLAARRRWSVGRALFWTLGAGLLLSPTVHPWYVLWVLPLAALYRSRGWVLFGGLAFLAYWGHDAYRATGTWPRPAWLGLLIWCPFLLVLLADALRGRPRGAWPLDGPG